MCVFACTYQVKETRTDHWGKRGTTDKQQHWSSLQEKWKCKKKKRIKCLCVICSQLQYSVLSCTTTVIPWMFVFPSGEALTHEHTNLSLHNCRRSHHTGLHSHAPPSSSPTCAQFQSFLRLLLNTLLMGICFPEGVNRRSGDNELANKTAAAAAAAPPLLCNSWAVGVSARIKARWKHTVHRHNSFSHISCIWKQVCSPQRSQQCFL